jgi:hypothetical protein
MLQRQENTRSRRRRPSSFSRRTPRRFCANRSTV